ncbi:unnamed protein product [Symbiodinium natans]|uniref:Uncharacterized protein n=1 Tax=Symbiodinium natans TaxID=878477 RepID=A0A812NWM7_9DINO|nr:unnamed protein product [Symbiodinium natans]
MAVAMSRTLKASAVSERIYSPTPSSVCPTESTAPGEADLADCDSEGEGRPSRCEGEVRSWSQVSERLRGLFCELVEEDDEDMESLGAPFAPFSSVLSPMAEESSVAKSFFEQESAEGEECDVQNESPLASEELLEPISVKDWHAVGCRLAHILHQCAMEDSDDEDLPQNREDPDEDEAEAEPEPM